MKTDKLLEYGLLAVLAGGIAYAVYTFWPRPVPAGSSAAPLPGSQEWKDQRIAEGKQPYENSDDDGFSLGNRWAYPGGSSEFDETLGSGGFGVSLGGSAWARPEELVN